eukprot:jgi/Undpi1/7074/HiC_scaffold_22.g09548.m1
MVVGGGNADGGEEAGGPPDNERQLLETELVEVECMLAGEIQQIESLAKENTKKVEELRGLSEDVKLLQERNDYDVSMLQDEHASTQQEVAHALMVLREQLAQLNLQHTRYKDKVAQNDADGLEVESLLANMELRTKTHGEEVHAIRQEMLHLRQALESTFRKTLKDLEGTYRRKAFMALGSEAKAGMRANKILRDEMALQELGISALGMRHADQCRKAGEFQGEVSSLSGFEEEHKSALADLQRETRKNELFLADMQETKSRISAAERSLWKKLTKQGVPVRNRAGSGKRTR